MSDTSSAAAPGSQTVLVTGASTGIGRDAARHLAERGYHVLAGVRKDEDAEAIRGEGLPSLEPIRIDVADPDSIRACAAEFTGRFGGEGLHAIVNNAGIVISSTLEFVPLDAFRRQLEVNVTGQLAVTQALFPLIRMAKERNPASGRIIFTGSTSGYFAAPFVGPYNASKFAIEGLADSLRRELRPWGIAVSIIQPGAIKTPIWEKSETVADDILAGLPARARELYGETIDDVKEQIHERAASAAPVELCSKAIHHAVSARRPKFRYKVGADAWVQFVLARLLPPRWVDGLVSKMVG